VAGGHPGPAHLVRPRAGQGSALGR
jgi:hypothetical protein